MLYASVLFLSPFFFLLLASYHSGFIYSCAYSIKIIFPILILFNLSILLVFTSFQFLIRTLDEFKGLCLSVRHSADLNDLHEIHFSWKIIWNSRFLNKMINHCWTYIILPDFLDINSYSKGTQSFFFWPGWYILSFCLLWGMQKMWLIN